MRKSVVSSIMAAIILSVVLLSSSSIALASEPSIKVNVHAKAEGNSITASGKVFLSGLESGKEVTIYIMIILRKPDGSNEEAEFSITGLIDGNCVTILPYEYTFKGCINKKGIYKITVTAIYEELMDTAYFKFDPPTGGTPGVPF
ncbi:MAG: hypothetical protein QW457_00690 [Candidatus Bathyarchaeia archaeon]